MALSRRSKVKKKSNWERSQYPESKSIKACWQLCGKWQAHSSLGLVVWWIQRPGVDGAGRWCLGYHSWLHSVDILGLLLLGMILLENDSNSTMLIFLRSNETKTYNSQYRIGHVVITHTGPLLIVIYSIHIYNSSFPYPFPFPPFCPPQSPQHISHLFPISCLFTVMIH